MTKPKVLNKKIEYQGCPIVIRLLGDQFEYITCVNNEIYSSYVVARKPLLTRLFGRSYSIKQLDKITNYMIAMAQTTIDSVLGVEQPVVSQK